MLLRKSILGLLLICISLSPFTVSAQVSYVDTTIQNRIQLLIQIEKLLKEVLLLQAQLERQILIEQRKRSSSKSNLRQAVYKSNFFEFPFEEIYFLKSNALVNSDGTDIVRIKDQQLFDLFEDVVGSDVVNKYVQEWRIFNNEELDIGAFVELMSTGRDDWIVGVNSSNFSSNTENVRRSFSNLFIHEYSHILLYEQSGFAERYENRFWSEEDYLHKTNVEKANPLDRFKIMNRYYDRNRNRFVDDYATVSPAEDMSESFVIFVLEDIPTGNTLRDKKVLSFYQEEEFIEARKKIRSNLRKLGLL